MLRTPVNVCTKVYGKTEYKKFRRDVSLERKGHPCLAKVKAHLFET